MSPHESVTTDAPLVMAVFTAASRLLSRQSWAPTKMMSAPGAMRVRRLDVQGLLVVPAAAGALGLVVDRRRRQVDELGAGERVGGSLSEK